MDVDAIENIITEFCDKYKIDLETDDVGEIIYQSEFAYEDAVSYFVKILKECQP